MNRARIRALVCASLAAAALAGCTASQEEAASADAAAPTVSRSDTSTRLVERDVEAPQVFQVTDQALWDGRPSLGGVWVASPDAVDPERVILRNPANGKFVIGALFRRERLNPGPPLQISSDAAAALGILAGQPTNLNVTALRREEATDAAAPPPEPTKPILDSAETVETTALAAAAIDRAEGKPSTEAALPPPVATAPVAATIGGTAAPAADVAATGATTDAAAAEVPPALPEKKLPFWKRKKAAAQADETLAAEAAAEVMPLAPVVAAAATTTTTALTTAPAPLPKPATAAPKTGRAIQIGIFSVEANATRAVDALAKAGVTSRVVTEASHGKTFWRVIADPAADGAATLAKVKSAGFADAYFVSG